MLKLIYQTDVFGPIDLEYDRPVIRVGRNEDNDLVLRHPSVAPYQCLLLFRDEKLLCLAPEEDVSEETDLRSLTGPEFGAGDSLQIGDLQFILAHSANTVAIPEVHRPPAKGGSVEASASAAANKEPARSPYYCPNCRTFIPEAAVKRVDLVGHAKRDLCPKCSRALETEAKAEPEPEKPAPAPKKGWRQATRLFVVL